MMIKITSTKIQDCGKILEEVKYKKILLVWKKEGLKAKYEEWEENC